MLEKYERVYAAVDLSAALYNMERMHEAVSPQTKMIGVIKTDGYGHGAVPIGRELETLPYVSGYAVATAEEAFILRRAGLSKPILILGYTFPTVIMSWSCRRSVPPFSERMRWRLLTSAPADWAEKRLCM